MPINFNSFMNAFSGFRKNPMQEFIQNGINVPQNLQNDPRGIIQNLMDSGRMSQQQYNQLQHMAAQIQNNPQFLNYFRK